MHAMFKASDGVISVSLTESSSVFACLQVSLQKSHTLNNPSSHFPNISQLWIGTVLAFCSLQNAMKAGFWNFISKLMFMAQEYVTQEKDVQQQWQW